MNTQMTFHSGDKQGLVHHWTRIAIAAALTLAITFVSFVPQASADGATQISGVAYFADPGECTDDATGPNGEAPTFALNMTGDLQGCHYVFVETAECAPSGVYHERGSELYVGSGAAGDDGSFRTSYQFSGKFEDCANLIGEIFGRCEHPIVASTGTGDYEGVTGRLDFKDDVINIEFPYRGHLRW